MTYQSYHSFEKKNNMIYYRIPHWYWKCPVASILWIYRHNYIEIHMLLTSVIACILCALPKCQCLPYSKGELESVRGSAGAQTKLKKTNKKKSNWSSTRNMLPSTVPHPHNIPKASETTQSFTPGSYFLFMYKYSVSTYTHYEILPSPHAVLGVNLSTVVLSILVFCPTLL